MDSYREIRKKFPKIKIEIFENQKSGQKVANFILFFNFDVHKKAE